MNILNKFKKWMEKNVRSFDLKMMQTQTQIGLGV